MFALHNVAPRGVHHLQGEAGVEDVGHHPPGPVPEPKKPVAKPV